MLSAYFNVKASAAGLPRRAPTLSAKDENAPFLKDIAEDRLPVYVP